MRLVVLSNLIVKESKFYLSALMFDTDSKDKLYKERPISDALALSWLKSEFISGAISSRRSKVK